MEADCLIERRRGALVECDGLVGVTCVDASSCLWHADSAKVEVDRTGVPPAVYEKAGREGEGESDEDEDDGDAPNGEDGGGERRGPRGRKKEEEKDVEDGSNLLFDIH